MNLPPGTNHSTEHDYRRSNPLSVIIPPKERFAGTVLVTGPPRSGTTMVARVLEELGIDMKADSRHNMESLDINRRRQDVPRMGEDEEYRKQRAEKIMCHVRGWQRAARVPWGLKDPFMHLYLNELLWEVKQPRVLIVFRGMAAIAERSRIASGTDPVQSARGTIRLYDRLITHVEHLVACKEPKVPTAFISYEKTLMMPEVFVKQLAEFCGREVNERANGVIQPETGYVIG